MVVVNADAILHCLVTHIVSGAVDTALLYASAGHPDAEAAGTVIATG